MTNKEYFERNNIPFATAMKMYDVKKYGTFEQFLYAKRSVEHKYNVGDVIVYYEGYTNIVYDIDIDRELYYTIYYSTRFDAWRKDKIGINDLHSTNNCKIGHSDLQFAVKLGIIEDEDISREISEYE